MVVEWNIAIKREFQKFVARNIYHKENNIDNLSKVYFYLDDIVRYVENLQADIGTKLLDLDFKECYLEDLDIKVWLDEELSSILVDKISDSEKKMLLKKSNERILEEQTKKATHKWLQKKLDLAISKML